MFIKLKPRAERTETSTEVIQRLRRTANTVPGLKVTFQNVQNLNITGRVSKSQYQYTLQSSDTDALYKIAPEMAENMAKLQGVVDVETDLSVRNPQMSVEIDREQAAIYGISIEQIRQEMFNAFGAREVATIFTQNADYPIIMETMPEFQTDPSALSRIHIKTSAGQSIPLEAVTRITPTVGPLMVNHQAAQPSVTISFNLVPGYSLGSTVEAIQGIEREANLPATIATGFQGTAQVFEDLSKRASRSCWLPRSSPPMCCSAFCMRASSTRSSSSQACRTGGRGCAADADCVSMDLSVIAMIGVVMLVGIVMKKPS